MTEVEVSGLRLTYPGPPAVEALRGVDLRLPDGGLVAVVGPSGCGKTTLLRSVAGTERPGAGRVVVAGQEVVGPGTFVPPERRRIGLVPQEGALFPHLDVAGNVGFGLRALDRAARRHRVEELLELVGLPGSGRRRPHELSGGQQQRVALARALAPRPRAVLLDEPFSALDATLRTSLREEVAGLLRQAGTTALLVTHDRDEALSWADTVAVMDRGLVLQVGTPREVYLRPRDERVARLLGDLVVLPARSDGVHAHCALGRVEVHGQVGRTHVGVRPEQVVADADGVPAVVEEVRFRGHDATVVLRLDGPDGPSGLVVRARWPAVVLPAVGDAVRVRVQGSVLGLDGPGPPGS